MGEYLIVQTVETLDYTMTEIREELQSLAFGSNSVVWNHWTRN